MTDYIAPRSVSRLEEEIAALEGKQAEELETETTEVPVREEVLTKDEETWKKRYSDLRRTSQKQMDDLKRLTKEVEDLKSTKTKPTLNISSVEEATKWARENPQAASIIRALANEQVGSKEDDVKAIRLELEKNKQEARIKKAHPDFEDITASDEFHDWAESQPQTMQKLIYDGEAEDVIWALSAYKKEMVANQINPTKEAAKSVVNKLSSAPADGSGKKTFTESQVQKMSMAEYEKNEAAIAQSQRDGTFVYDLSGAAR